MDDDPSAASRGEARAALLRHARALVGTTLSELAEGLGLPVPAGRVRSKGWPGLVIQQELGVDVDGARGPDFGELGIELKTVPVGDDGRPLESTAVCQIDPVAIAGESWATSYVRAKLAHVLFVTLQVPRGSSSVGERRIRDVVAWSPSADDERRLGADFDHVVREYFRKGRLDGLSAHVGEVLQVRPKGRNAADTRAGFDADGRATRVGKCGFYLRPAFVAHILARSG